jgi:hypothetical protein
VGATGGGELPLIKYTTVASKLAAKFKLLRLARGEEKATPTKERMTMFAFAEGHPNIDVIIFYVLASAILAVSLYYFHQKQV